MTTKQCTKCGETKPISRFHRHANKKPDGRDPRCADCKRTAQRASMRKCLGVPVSEMLYPEFVRGSVWDYVIDGDTVTLIVKTVRLYPDAGYRVIGTQGEYAWAHWLRVHGRRVDVAHGVGEAAE